MGKRHIFYGGEYHTSYGEAKRKCLHLKSNLVDFHIRNKDFISPKMVRTIFEANLYLNDMKYIFQVTEWARTNCVPEFWIAGKNCSYKGPDGTADNCGKRLPVICIKAVDTSICNG